MSAATVDEIVEKASVLTDEEKAAVAARLIRELPIADYDVSDEEVAERGRELENGTAKEMGWDEFVSGLEFKAS